MKWYKHDNKKTKLEKELYNAIPVYYCLQCLSLKIKGLDYAPNINYCMYCGSTDILQTLINKWEEEYKKRYNKTLI